MSSMTQHQLLSQELLYRVPLIVLSVPPFFLKREKENQDCILEIVSRYIIHFKITKCNNSVNKAYLFKWICFFLYLFKFLFFSASKFQIKHLKALGAAGNEIEIKFGV